MTRGKSLPFSLGNDYWSHKPQGALRESSPELVSQVLLKHRAELLRKTCSSFSAPSCKPKVCHFYSNLILNLDFGMSYCLSVKNVKSLWFTTSAAVNPTFASLTTSWSPVLICKTLWCSFSESQWNTLCGLTPTGAPESTVEGALGGEAPNHWMCVWASKDREENLAKFSSSGCLLSRRRPWTMHPSLATAEFFLCVSGFVMMGWVTVVVWESG